MKILSATLADLPPIESLRRQDADSLGFVPASRFESIIRQMPHFGASRWKYERIVVAREADEIVGFAYAGFHRDGMKIEQLCIRSDARRMERGLILVHTLEMESMRRGSKRARCRVAADIEANLFWIAAGFQPVASVFSSAYGRKPSQSQRPLIVYDKPLNQLAFEVTP